MNKYTIKYVWLPILILSGCTASLQQRVDKMDNADSKQLEKRIDDLSGTITLIVNDTNRLHNKMEAVTTSNKGIQQKIEGLEATVKNLAERIVSLSTSAKTLEIIQPSVKETEIKPQLLLTDTSNPSEKPDPDIQKTVHAEDQLAAAKGFWDAMNAKDIQAIRLYVTKESADKLQIKEKDTPGYCEATFGNIKIEDDKTIIDTTMHTNEGTTEFQVQMQTILVKEDGQWKVDANQTMMSMLGGAMGEMMNGLGKALEEGFKKGFEEMGKSMTEGMQKGVEVMTQDSEALPDATPSPKSETTILDQTKKIGLEESKQISETEPDITPTKQEPAMINEPSKRESYLRDNIVRLAEAELPENKGIKGILCNIIRLEHKAHLIYAVVEPNPANLDYPRFKFAVSFENSEMPRVIGTYCFKGQN